MQKVGDPIEVKASPLLNNLSRSSVQFVFPRVSECQGESIMKRGVLRRLKRAGKRQRVSSRITTPAGKANNEPAGHKLSSKPDIPNPYLIWRALLIPYQITFPHPIEPPTDPSNHFRRFIFRESPRGFSADSPGVRLCGKVPLRRGPS